MANNRVMEKLEPTDGMELDMNGQMNELLTFKKDQLQKLQSAVLSEQSTLATTKQQIEETKREAKYQQIVDKEKFLQSLEQEKQSIVFERKQLEQLDLELNGRRKDVEILEAQAIPARESIKKLADERMAIEQQRLRLEQIRSESDQLANSTSSMHQEVANLRVDLINKTNAVSKQQVDLDSLQEQLTKQQKDVSLQVDNLAKLKETIDPKLAEIRQLQEKAEADLNQAQLIRDSANKQQAEFDKQRSDLAILSGQLKAKSDALTEYDGVIKRAEAELRIKIQQSGIDVKLQARPDVDKEVKKANGG